jgi:hypothetical protein
MKVELPGSSALVRVSAGLALVALGLIVWSVVSPRPLAVIAAMSVGQGLGTLSFLLFGIAVHRDLKRSKVFDETDPPA